MTHGFDSSVNRQTEIIGHNNELQQIRDNAACQMHLWLCQCPFCPFHHWLWMSNKAWDFKWSWVWHMAWTDDGTYAVPSQQAARQWGEKESWNCAGCYLTLNGEWAMIKTIKPNLTSNMLHQQPQSLQASLPRPTTHCKPAFELTFALKSYLSPSKIKKKKKSCHCEIILAALAPTSLISRASYFSDDILKYSADHSTYFKIVSPDSRKLSCSAAGKVNHSTNMSKHLFWGRCQKNKKSLNGTLWEFTVCSSG